MPRAWYFASHGQTEWLALLLWLVFLFWQLFPVVATAFTETFDTSNLLRFPLSYPLFFLVRFVYGSLDPATALGSLWLFGMWVGVTFADLRLLVWAAVVLLVFALTNILIARMVFSWVERWLAQRRTREIMGIVFFLIIIAFQFIGPLTGRLAGRKTHPDVTRAAAILLPLQRALPPGLTASALADFSQAESRGWPRLVRPALRLRDCRVRVAERAHARPVSGREPRAKPSPARPLAVRKSCLFALDGTCRASRGLSPQFSRRSLAISRAVGRCFSR